MTSHLCRPVVPIRARVKWFRGAFGFLADGDGHDYFVHWTSIIVDEKTERDVDGRPFRKLAELQDVEILEYESREKGLKATRVRKL